MTDSNTNPLLIISWGNPSRGDDAIGPQLHDRLESLNLPQVELITDFQLQIEHCMDIADRSTVVFIDASQSATEPYEFSEIYPLKDDSFTSHAMSPQALLSVCQQVNGSKLPHCYLLAVKGYDFELGHAISLQAQQNMNAAYEKILALLDTIKEKSDNTS